MISNCKYLYIIILDSLFLSQVKNEKKNECDVINDYIHSGMNIHETRKYEIVKCNTRYKKNEFVYKSPHIESCMNNNSNYNTEYLFDIIQDIRIQKCKYKYKSKTVYSYLLFIVIFIRLKVLISHILYNLFIEHYMFKCLITHRTFSLYCLIKDVHLSITMSHLSATQRDFPLITNLLKIHSNSKNRIISTIAKYIPGDIIIFHYSHNTSSFFQIKSTYVIFYKHSYKQFDSTIFDHCFYSCQAFISVKVVRQLKKENKTCYLLNQENMFPKNVLLKCITNQKNEMNISYLKEYKQTILYCLILLVKFSTCLHKRYCSFYIEDINSCSKIHVCIEQILYIDLSLFDIYICICIVIQEFISLNMLTCQYFKHIPILIRKL